MLYMVVLLFGCMVLLLFACMVLLCYYIIITGVVYMWLETSLQAIHINVSFLQEGKDYIIL